MSQQIESRKHKSLQDSQFKSRALIQEEDSKSENSLQEHLRKTVK